jgi:hypothetical protein
MPDLEELGNPEHTLLSMSLASLMSDETLAELDERVGPEFRSLPEAARFALATALLEGEVTNARLKTATGLHRTDLTQLLRDLTRRGFLISVGRGRGTHYHLLGNTLDLDQQVQLLDFDGHNTASQQNGSCSQHNDPSSQHNAEQNGGGQPSIAEWEELMAKALVLREHERARSGDQVRALILDLTKDHFLTLRQLAELLNRTEGTLQNHYLRGMLRSGELELRYPDPTHPQQAYRARVAR